MSADESKQLDPTTLTLWYREYAVRLRAFLLGLLKNMTLVDEALQATFTKALTSGGNVQAGSEKAWLFQVAFNEAMLLKRRAETHQRALHQLGTPLRENRQPIEHLLSWDSVHQVRMALEQLPEKQKQIVRLRIENEWTFQQIADHLELPLGTVLTRMRTALQNLRESLRQFDDKD